MTQITDSRALRNTIRRTLLPTALCKTPAMFPTFGAESKRQINLGGRSTAQSSSYLLSRAHAERAKREEDRRRNESAVRIQAWFRGAKDARDVRRQMKQVFLEQPTTLTGLRSLVLLRQDEEVLSVWSAAIGDGAQIFSLMNGRDAPSWETLIQRAALMLVHSIADDPQGVHSLAHLQALDVLLQPTVAQRYAGAEGATTVRRIIGYLVRRGLYKQLSRAIRGLPAMPKNPPPLGRIIDVILRPFVALPHTLPEVVHAFSETFRWVLTIPLLPNRLLPIQRLPQFTSAVPFTQMNLLQSTYPALINNMPTEDRIHLTANLHAFISPSYKNQTFASLQTYLATAVILLDSFSLGALTSPSSKNGKSQQIWTAAPYDSDSEESSTTRVNVVGTFTPPIKLPEVDPKTVKRLSSIASTPHLKSLISVAENRHFIPLISYIMSLSTSWPSVRNDVLNTVLASSRDGTIRMVYRQWVRGSPLGKDGRSSTVFDPANAQYWKPLLFLVDLYTQALLTMGDDEFFGTAKDTRNPLSLDELIALSRQLLNIAFSLYLMDDPTRLPPTVSPDFNCSWPSARDRLTKCLVAIHARDCRRRFTPPDHWLAVSPGDLEFFIEAALIEQRELSKADSAVQFSSRSLASAAPRIGILNNLPFALPFEARVSIFRHFIVDDLMTRGNGFRNPFSKQRVVIRRERVAEDGFDRLGGVDLKQPIEIVFIDQFGQEEAGIDGGGVFKEFFTSLCKEVFDTDRGLWLATKQNELYPNPHTYATEAHSLNWFRFLGRILGKAMYEGILVDVAFANFFLAKWLGKQSYLDDLSSLDPDLYNGLVFLKHYTGDLEDLALNFTVAVDEFGMATSIDLIPNGSNTPVTKENRLAYIYLVSHYRLNKQIKRQSEAFFDGLSEMIDPRWLRMFDPQEVKVLIGGVNSPIDLDDLRKNTNYGGLYDDDHPTIRLFWQVVNGFNQEQRRALLRFVSSCSRPPLLGFKELVPNFSIRDAGTDQYRLPTASTCVNLLKLPLYSTESQLRAKLLQAINAGAGFDLS